MIYYEIKKLLKNRFLIIAFIVFLVFDYYLVREDSMEIILSKRQPEYTKLNEIYCNVKGNITNEKLEYLLNKASEDLLYYNTGMLYYNDIIKLISYEERYKNAYECALENVAFYNSIGDWKNSRENQIIADAFEGRKITEFYTYEGEEKFLTHSFSLVCLAFLALVEVYILFVFERKTGMNEIVNTTRRGGRISDFCRWIAIMITSSVMLLLIRLFEAFLYNGYYGFDGLSNPMYYMKQYLSSLFNFSIIEGMIYDFLYKFLIIMIFIVISIVLAKIFTRKRYRW